MKPAVEPPAERLIARRGPMLRITEAGLSMEGVVLAEIAAAVGTPTWVIGAGTIRARYARLEAALDAHRIGPGAIHYAVKANDHRAVLALLGGLGAGADAVSFGEIERALQAGMTAGRVVFSGVGKTAAELRAAVRVGVAQVNVESIEELRELAQIGRDAGRVQDVALRVNPDVDAGAHDKISTGRSGDKFGVPLASAARVYAEAAGLEGVRPIGLAVHIGSQIINGGPFAQAAERMAGLIREIRGTGLSVDAVDAGGGLGISYDDGPDGDPDEFAGAIAEGLGSLGVRLAVEPGRWLVGPAGVLLSRVVRIKEAPTPFMILDSAMNDLLRPTLYGAWHGVVPVAPFAAEATRSYDVVGPVCESGDVLARARRLPLCAAGDCVAILDAGGYGAVMSSTYNTRPLAAQVMVDDGRWSVIRPRQPVEALWRDERLPDWTADR